ncbi:alpha/beta fold hydrolase [Halarcobacter anaerophilus]|uniref:alpha/beta fold hydrolase n=1 Tax=Halarcobacter anaerophilus TaxID=877500 RepID=UPI0005CA21A0|nr:alpha/beta hydrolase [Halarcobacter anaerophilus]
MKEKIYLIPGLMTDERLWSRLLPFLEKQYELIHFPIPLNENFDEMVKVLDKEIKDEKVNLLGFSLGGYISSYYAIKNPKRVKRLFLVSATPSATVKENVKKREKKLKEAKNNNFPTLSLEKAKDLLEIKEDEELIQIVASMFNDLGNEVYIPQLASTLRRVEMFEDFIKLNFPVRFYYSLNDRLLNHLSINKILNKKENIQLVSREGTSHNIPLEFPKELSIEIKKWFEQKI